MNWSALVGSDWQISCVVFRLALLAFGTEAGLACIACDLRDRHTYEMLTLPTS